MATAATSKDQERTRFSGEHSAQEGEREEEEREEEREEDEGVRPR
jgi:hypothetical protein